MSWPRGTRNDNQIVLISTSHYRENIAITTRLGKKIIKKKKGRKKELKDERKKDKCELAQFIFTIGHKKDQIRENPKVTTIFQEYVLDIAGTCILKFFLTRIITSRTLFLVVMLFLPCQHL